MASIKCYFAMDTANLKWGKRSLIKTNFPESKVWIVLTGCYGKN